MDTFMRFEPDGEATRLAMDSDWEMPGHLPGFMKDLVDQGWAERNMHQALAEDRHPALRLPRLSLLCVGRCRVLPLLNGWDAHWTSGAAKPRNPAVSIWQRSAHTPPIGGEARSGGSIGTTSHAVATTVVPANGETGTPFGHMRA